MKSLMFAALAVAVATPVLAQTTPAPTTTDTTTQSTMSAPTPSDTTTQPSMPAADPATSAPMSPAAPTTTAPTSADPTMASSMAAPATSDGSYPMCSRSVTDHCTERSNRRGERLHSTPRARR